MKRGLIIGSLIFIISAASTAETTLTLVSSWNREQNFTALFMDYVDAVNEAGKGIVQIDFRGGPEVIPQRQLFYALRRGVIDMAFGGTTYYRGLLPEGDAIFASTITPMEARKNGALDALQPYWHERINAHLIGWMQSGIGVNIYLSEAPSFRADGMPDLTGLKIRTSPSNREILARLGGRTIQIAVKEIYTSLQRGTVDGLAWPTTGLPDLGIQSFINYRIDPAFLQLAICLQINLDTWNQLDAAAKRILTEQAILYEQRSRDTLFAIQARELKLLESQGLIAVEIPADAGDRYRKFAHQVVWDRFAARVPEAAKQLQPLFYPQDDDSR